jgi:hypothetical protein
MSPSGTRPMPGRKVQARGRVIIRYFTDKNVWNRVEHGHFAPSEHSNGLHGGQDA